MRCILPATVLPVILIVGCVSAAPPPAPARLGVVPVTDPALYQCAERTASDLGFDRQQRGRSGWGALLATTDTDRSTGRYDGLRVRILSDTGHVTTWLTASPYTEIANRPADARPLMPSRRALDAAATVERRCRRGRGD